MSRLYYASSGAIVLQKSTVPSIKRYSYFDPPSNFTSLDDALAYQPPNENALVALFWMGQDFTQRGQIFTDFIQRSTADEGDL